MKDYDFNSIISAITSASPSHLALVSFLVLPVVLDYWMAALLKFFPTISLAWKVIAFIFLIMVYLSCLIWLALENKKKAQLITQKNIVMGRLVANDWSSMSYTSARKVLGDFSDDEFVRLINAFPDTLRSVRMQDKENFDESGKPKKVPGIGRYNAQES